MSWALLQWHLSEWNWGKWTASNVRCSVCIIVISDTQLAICIIINTMIFAITVIITQSMSIPFQYLRQKLISYWLLKRNFRQLNILVHKHASLSLYTCPRCHMNRKFIPRNPSWGCFRRKKIYTICQCFCDAEIKVFLVGNISARHGLIMTTHLRLSWVHVSLTISSYHVAIIVIGKLPLEINIHNLITRVVLLCTTPLMWPVQRNCLMFWYRLYTIDPIDICIQS